MGGFTQSLRKLALDCVDLYLILDSARPGSDVGRREQLR